MLEFLKNENISNKTIKYLEENLSLDDKYALKDNKNECLKTIEIFKKIGINRIEEILVNSIYIFYHPTKEIVESLKKYDIEELVKDVNYDYINIDNYI